MEQLTKGKLTKTFKYFPYPPSLGKTRHFCKQTDDSVPLCACCAHCPRCVQKVISNSTQILSYCFMQTPRSSIPTVSIPGKQPKNRGLSGRSPRHLHSSSHFLFYYLKLRALISSQRNKSHSCSLVQVSAKRKKKKEKAAKLTLHFTA